LEGIGEICGVFGNYYIIDETGQGLELNSGNGSTGFSIIDISRASGTARDEEPASGSVELQSDCTAARRRFDNHLALARPQVTAIDLACRDGPNVKSRPVPASNAFRPEAIWQRDDPRERSSGRTADHRQTECDQ